MSKSTKKVDCPKCEAKKSILYSTTLTDKGVSVKIDKCEECGEQSYLKQIFDYVKNKD